MKDIKDIVVNIQKTSEEKDLGVIIDEKLSFEKHLIEKVNLANRNMGIIRRTFKFLDETTFQYLYKAQVRPHLEYANSVWKPYKAKDIDLLEKVQRRATKQIPGFRELSYEERLKKLGLYTLAYRRLRGDLIEVYKILTGLTDPETAPDLHLIGETDTRGNGRKLKIRRAEGGHNYRQNFFTIRVAKSWNSLPREVVWAKTLNSFKSRLDKHFEGHPLKWNYKSLDTY